MSAAGDYLSQLYQADLWVCDNPAAPLLPKFLRKLGFYPAELVANGGVLRTAFRKRYSNGFIL